MGGASCASQGFSGGTLTCNSNCTFNTSACTTASPPSSGGGGGGGGGGSTYYSVPVTTSAMFRGRAYPGSTVTLLKDAQVVAATVAGTDATFAITAGNLSAGSYLFSVYSEDNKGTRSSLLTFPVGITAGALTEVSGIFIAPTISVDKSEVKQGDVITFFGQSVPSGTITIVVSSEADLFATAKADVKGVYLHYFDTDPLEFGSHTVRARGAAGGLVSSYSAAVGFAVGYKNILKATSTTAAVKGDMNGDKRVNILDFSVAAYWYKRPSPPPTADLNSDGKVDLIDLSILASRWTG
ncbi:MAG: dockerin type I domain-containing protein [Candidatus Jorgensenbacteria bacterium]